MNKILLALHSRTIWTLVVMFVYNVLALYGHALSPSLNTLVTAVLGLLVGYFKLNPGQVYPISTTPTVQPTV
jgi:hypothetical protein